MKIINLLKYALLGIIQGITEPLPISSSGHIYVLKNVLNTNLGNDLNFEIIVNAASLLAIIIIYRKDIIDLIISDYNYIFKKDNKYKYDFNYTIYLIIGIIPIMVMGLLLKDYIELKLNNIKIVGIAFLITSFFLFIIRSYNGIKNTYDIRLKHSVIIGLSSILALLPGISRSGTVYVSSTLCNIDKESALKYSFLMYIPISIGSIILGLKDMNYSLTIPYIIGFIISFITSLLTLKWLINKFNNNQLLYFSIYTFIIGIMVIIFV